MTDRRKTLTDERCSTETPNPAPNQNVIERISAALDCLEYGAVTVTVHASKVVQIDVTERLRFT
ncbi:hypothetical protein PB2503_03722 [Parvularcula bermudensis HTCC2503]|uniref:DUF2292 domain-containing protein n=1 Tax=Parvularcula bermudensis (strain ATCC BAA-594 / HTCC2503 / KCTC 12087) TaxID=314260 RepID=E0TDZ8_PARBH|nr:YezD family protein [Parvularcula bermudensis]ADM08819.1 hypothetical protein PB2503_03722 [Parvularcula bermudensis HTCC2503]